MRLGNSPADATLGGDTTFAGIVAFDKDPVATVGGGAVG